MTSLEPAGPQIRAEWATDDGEGVTDVLGVPVMGIVLFFRKDSASPQIAVGIRDLRAALDSGGEAWVGVDDCLVGGNAEQWQDLLVRLSAVGIRGGILEAPLSRRSSQFFRAQVSPREVVAGDG